VGRVGKIAGLISTGIIFGYNRNVDVITSFSNPLIKQARMLRQRKVRAETGLFLVEGIHHVAEVIEAKWNVDTILYAPDLLTSDFAQDLLGEVTRLSLRLQPVSIKVMESLADKENPQGIVALVNQKQTGLDDLHPFQRGVALVSPQDPGNVGTILRTLDAVGVDALFLLDGGVEPYHPTAVRASMGSLFWKPVVQTKFSEFNEWARKKHCQLIGTSAKADVDYHTLVPGVPWILVMGSEQKGLSREQTSACDVTIALPMRGRTSSLNLAVAVGILLYQFIVDK
jgi:RNA methyltransferase, TrmH family